MDGSKTGREAEREAIQQKVAELMLEHRDLDDVIRRMSEDTYVDQLQLKRLKKRKLAVKDRMEKLKSRLLPDILA